MGDRKQKGGQKTSVRKEIIHTRKQKGNQKASVRKEIIHTRKQKGGQKASVRKISANADNITTKKNGATRAP
jgi:hypothetical protein